MNASARVRYMRIAFGIASEGQPVSRPEIQSILADMSRAGRVRYDWTLTQDCARSDAQHVFLAMMCLEAAMPRGGTILARGDDAHWLITGPAEDDRPSPALWSMLTGAEGVDPLPAQVQFALLPEILKDTGAQVEILRASSGLTLRLPRA
jgi:histidine phosphotransferase ChpT